MKEMGTKEKILAAVLVLATVAAVLYSGNSLFVDGVLSWHIRQKEYGFMMAEAMVLFLLFLAVLRWTRSARSTFIGIAAVMSAFLWIHVTFLPVMVSGLYLWYLCRVGREIRTRVSGQVEGQEPFRDFLMGAMAVICLFCVMSAIGAGSIPQMQTVVVVTGAGFVVYEVVMRSPLAGCRRCGNMSQRSASRILFYGEAGEKTGSIRSLGTTLGLAFVLTMFCIQAGRMNIAVDYDSRWYGIRSPYILNIGGGIYENMGTVGVVYTYSKGLETLTLPLSTLPSYSFQISFNLWLAAGVLLSIYRCARYLMGRQSAMMLTVLLSSIPGIMNMTITAKTDIATLLVQLIMIEELLRLMRCEKKALAYSLAAFLFSWTLKPTALVFSTAVYGMGILGILLIKGWKALTGSAMRGRNGLEQLLALLLGIGTLVGMWARTFLITGMPVTSVFSSIFGRLGFAMKYPYSVQSVPNSGSDMSAYEWLCFFGKRLHHVLFAPLGDDMAHVIIAWGSLSLFFFGCVFMVGALARKRERDEEERQLDRWFALVFLPFLAGNLLSLAMLTQVDGNYFMLLYVLAGFGSFRMLEAGALGRLKTVTVKLSALVMVYSAVVTGATNWEWALGFSPVDVANRGYYNHRLVARDEMRMQGAGQIWDILEQEPKSRVIAFGHHPDVLVLPCCVQSYADLQGTQGNIDLVRTKENFRQYLEWAKTDYIYVQADYMAPDAHEAKLVSRMIEYGLMVPVCYASGNALFAVDTEGSRTEESLRRLEEFEQQYWR